MEQTAYLNLAMERLNHNFPRSPNDFSLFIITFDSIHFSFKFLAVTTAANYVSKKFNTFNLQFHNFYSCIMNFFIFDLTYIFCLYFLDSFNYEDSLMKYLHNRNNYSFHSFDCDICLDYVMFFY